MARPRPEPLPPEERAREICLRALERRMHSRRELALKLRQKGVPEEVGEAVLDRLAEVGLVDDEAFARMYVTSRQRSRPRGHRGLLAELLRKGIERETAAAILEELEEEEDPVETARRAVAAKLRSLSGRPPRERKRKAMDFLVRRGFGYDVAARALEDLEEEGEEEAP